MGFVFVFRSASERRRADKLAKALRERGLDVCVGLEREPAEVRSSVSRALADHCSVMAALWTEADAADAAFVEPMRHAASMGKLLALSPPGAQPPANLGPAIEVSQTWVASAAELASVCDAIAQAAARNSPPGDDGGDAAASEEYAAYQRMLRQGGVEAMARFLREYPGGMFEEIVRAELDAATRPSYQPARRSSWAVGDASHEAPGQVWRMSEWPGVRALRGLGKFWPWAGAAVVAVAAITLGSLAPWSARPSGDEAVQIEAAAERPFAQVRIAPIDASASPAAPANVESGAGEATVENIELGVALAPAETISGERIAGVLAAPPQPAPQFPPAAHEPVATAQPLPTMPPEPARARTSPDIANLEASMREVVQRARSSEVRALAQARSRTGVARVVPGGAAAGAGVYYGDWSDGAANGVGRAMWANGDAYAGAWSASRPEGYGVLRLSDGRHYEGEFAAGSPTGRGVFWDEDGSRLTGDRLFATLVSARTR